MRTIRDVNLEDKVVILRADLNLPIVQGHITDVYRLERTLPTIEYLIQNKAKTIILSHYGRPKGKFVPDMSLAPIADELSKALKNKPVHFAIDILDRSLKSRIEALKPGDVLLVENIRFHPEEEANDLEFAKKIAELGDIYVNEAFSCSHRAHASIESIPKFLPSYAGFLLEEEVNTLNKHLETPKKPVMAITGGSKVSSKLGLLLSLIKKVDIMVIGGAMANTFLKANGHEIGTSLYEPAYLETAQNVLKTAAEHNCRIILPSDVVTAENFEDVEHCHVKPTNAVARDEMILDVGPNFIYEILTALKTVKTVIWNGPLGAFEHKPFDIGTSTIARAIAGLTLSGDIISVVGGGDVVSAINCSKLSGSFTYTSTGGGAFLEWLEGRPFPGMTALLENQKP